MNAKHLNEICALMLVGDGVLTAVDPKRHLKLWRLGPRPCMRAMDTLVRHPGITRALGVAAAVAGVWWASRQKPTRTSFLFKRSA
jgi:hypothetical protein